MNEIKYVGISNYDSEENKYFIINNKGELSADYTKAYKFNKIGEAMKACAIANNLLGKYAFRVMSLY